MGKGDVKTKKGKIWRGSFGNSRKRKAVVKSFTAPAVEVQVEKEAPKKSTKK
ncbi:MAG: 30S ribosomal protein THX [Cytophagales bacterium]